MARYRNSRVKIVRRLGLLPGFTSKTSNNKLNNVTNLYKLSQYGLRLQEKQKLRYNYGITESQMLKYVKLARKLQGNTGNRLFQLLEMRLDNIVYRSGLTPTINAARQLISHGHVSINKRKVTIPSYNCKILNQIKIDKSILNSIQLNNVKIENSLLVSSTTDSFCIDINDYLYSVQLTVNILLVLEYYSGR